ncbi:MAG: molybdopterin-dependent oxidoreductase [Planctomycetota bacterium]|nr:molybdopterin-dependent oxidoreductase [Planctomycetota bacterium]
MKASTHKTACILCSLNCGLEVETKDKAIVSVKGDKDHPVSKGYLCQKAARLDYYQNNPNRITKPLKRNVAGGFDEISWDQAISEVAQKLLSLKTSQGGHSLAYYGGGGQGNHMGGAHSGTLRGAMGTRYLYNSLAQEKTGGFWVNGKLFGRQTCHPSEDIEHSDYLLIIGTNPWQSHGFPRARKELTAISKDPARTMVVVDPRRTGTAKRGDIYWSIKPGTDAQLMIAMIAIMIQEELFNKEFLAEHCVGFDQVQLHFGKINIDEMIDITGLDKDSVRKVTRDFCKAKAGCVRTDLGLEHSINSTLNTYLSKLLFLLPGHFGKKGTTNLHTSLVPLIGHSREPDSGAYKTKVTGMHEISKFFPPNILPLEIDTDHPERVRGVVVDSGNPLVTAADTQAYEAAFKKLELLVVIDVALTETAKLAHYVLPVATQFEKWEATFFNLEFPENFFHLRRPLFDAPDTVLTEPEIYRRIAVAMGALPERFPILEQVAKLDRRFPKLKLFPIALAATLKRKPHWKQMLPIILHQTMGKLLPDGANVGAVLWGSSHMYVNEYGNEAVEAAGVENKGQGIGEALFEKIMGSPSGTFISKHQYEDSFQFIKHKDSKIHLAIDELFTEIQNLKPYQSSTEFPYLLMAGERRSYNANTIIRNEAWRKLDPDGCLKIHPSDAAREGVKTGDEAWLETARGHLKITLSVTDEINAGVLSLPHGYGLSHPGKADEKDGAAVKMGPLINSLTDSLHCDPIAKTPFHKHIPARLRAS